MAELPKDKNFGVLGLFCFLMYLQIEIEEGKNWHAPKQATLK
jgi:hypothetical protein